MSTQGLGLQSLHMKTPKKKHEQLREWEEVIYGFIGAGPKKLERGA